MSWCRSNLHARLDDRLLDRLVIEAKLQGDLSHRFAGDVQPHGFTTLLCGHPDWSTLDVESVKSMVDGPFGRTELARNIDRPQSIAVECRDLLILLPSQAPRATNTGGVGSFDMLGGRSTTEVAKSLHLCS